jgi:hypothetical protein
LVPPVKTKGSMGGIFDAGISIDMSILTGVDNETLALVLDVLGIDGFGGGSIAEVDVLVEVEYQCFAALFG